MLEDILRGGLLAALEKYGLFEEDVDIRATASPDGLEVEVLDEPAAAGGDA